MKTYRFTIDGKPYEVVIDDLHARPINVTVNGEAVSVIPEDLPSPPPSTTDSPPVPTASPATSPPRGAPPDADSGAVLAPIPGVVLEIDVEPGDRVETGQELLVLEAMKMKNVIRAPYNGVVAAVHIHIGQQVQHHEPLLDLETA